jgi:hypothetical protein
MFRHPRGWRNWHRCWLSPRECLPALTPATSPLRIYDGSQVWIVPRQRTS